MVISLWSYLYLFDTPTTHHHGHMHVRILLAPIVMQIACEWRFGFLLSQLFRLQEKKKSCEKHVCGLMDWGITTEWIDKQDWAGQERTAKHILVCILIKWLGGYITMWAIQWLHSSQSSSSSTWSCYRPSCWHDIKQSAVVYLVNLAGHKGDGALGFWAVRYSSKGRSSNWANWKWTLQIRI